MLCGWKRARADLGGIVGNSGICGGPQLGIASVSYTHLDVYKRQVLEDAIRDDLNARAPRVMAVLRPLKVTLTNYAPEQVNGSTRPTGRATSTKRGREARR